MSWCKRKSENLEQIDWKKSFHTQKKKMNEFSREKMHWSTRITQTAYSSSRREKYFYEWKHVRSNTNRTQFGNKVEKPYFLPEFIDKRCVKLFRTSGWPFSSSITDSRLDCSLLLSLHLCILNLPNFIHWLSA